MFNPDNNNNNNNTFEDFKISIKFDDFIAEINTSDNDFLKKSKTNTLFKKQKITKKTFFDILPNSNIVQYKKQFNDNFDELAKTNRGLYIMKKWCVEDVKKAINNIFLKNKINLNWILLKNYIFSKNFREILKNLKIKEMIKNLKLAAIKILEDKIKKKKKKK